MGIFDDLSSSLSGLGQGFSQYMADPENAARIRGALIGVGQAAAQPYGNLGSIAAGAGQGEMTGINNYYAQQANKFGLANDQIGLQQKLGSANFMRQINAQISGQPYIPLTTADIMKGNFGGQAQQAPTPQYSQSLAGNAPMGVPNIPSINPAMPTQVQAQIPPTTHQDGSGQAAAPMQMAQTAPQGVVPTASQAPSNSQSLIPPDLFTNPVFRAAAAAGDTDTVMSMITKHQTQLTADELAARHLPADSLAFKAPDGTIDIKRQGTLKTPDEIAQEAQLKKKTILTPQEVAQKGMRPGTIATQDINGDVSILQAPDVKSPAAEAQDERISLADAKAHQSAMIDLLGPDYIDNQAKAIATYRAQPQQSSRNPAVTAAIMGRVYEINPNYDAKQFNGANRAVTAFDTGKQGDQVRSFNTSIAHLNTLQDLTTALKNGDVKAFNAAGNAVATQLGQPAPTNFEAAKNIVGDEIIKAIVGGGGALADRENAANQISAASSPAQLLGVIQTYKNLMAGQLVSLKKQYEGSTKLNDFNDKLLPETQKELGNISSKNLPQVDLSPANLSAAALKAGKTIDQIKQQLRDKGYQVP